MGRSVGPSVSSAQGECIKVMLLAVGCCEAWRQTSRRQYGSRTLRSRLKVVSLYGGW